MAISYRLSLYVVVVFQSESTEMYVCYKVVVILFFFRNIHILKRELSDLWEQQNHLTLVPGYTGNIAKVIQFRLCLVTNIELHHLQYYSRLVLFMLNY